MKPSQKNTFFLSTSLALRASLVMFSATLSASAATFTWDGGGADALTSTAANWIGDIAPGANQDFQFGAAGVSGSTLTYASGNLSSMTFNAGASAFAFTMPAGQIQFVQGTSNAIVNNSSNTQTFSAKVDVFFNGTKTFAANTAALSFANVGFRNDSMTAGQTNTLLFSGASNSTISGALSQTGAFTQLPTGFSNALTKSGTGTLTLTGTSTFTGLITVNNGTLTYNRSTVGLSGANALTFSGTGTFNMQNTGATGAQSMTLGALTFTSGEGTVQTTRTANQNEKITFASLAARGTGATGNFVNGGGTNGTANGFAFTTGPTASTIIDRGIFYNGSAYAAYDTTGFIRPLNYTSDTNATTATGVQSSLTLASTTDAQYVGSAGSTTTSGVATVGATSSLPVTNGSLFTVGQAITGTNIPANTWITAITGNTLTLSQGITAANPVASGTTLTPYNLVTAQTGGSLNTLNLSGAGASMTLAASQTLAVGGILRSGNSTAVAVINGGTAVTAATAGGELVVRADLANDTLVFNTPVQNNTTASSLTKSGAGLVNLLNTSTNYTGATRINGGTLRFNKTSTTTGAITPTSSISVAPGATLQLFVASSSTNTLAAPLTLSGNGVVTSYSLEFPNGNTQTNTLTGGITIVGGAIIRTFGLVNTYNFNTTKITGNATGSGLTFRADGGNSTNQPHTYNINVAADYTGNTTLLAQSQNAILKLGVANNALPATTSLFLNSAANHVNTSATLDLNGRNQTLAGLTAAPGLGGAKVINTSATASRLTINNPAAVSFSGVLGGTGTNNNNFGLTKSNAGTFTLTGVNTYTGTTQVSAGTLLIGTAGSLADTAVTVGGDSTSGTPTLAGGGTIGGATVIAAAGTGVVGTHSPGVAGVANGVGTQTFSSTLNYGSGSIFEWNLNAIPADVTNGTYDKVVANGTAGSVTGSSAIFKIVLSGNTFTDDFWNTNKSWTDIYSGTGAATDLTTIFSTFAPTTDIDSTGLVAGRGQFSFNGSSTLSWTAVPEPTSALAGLLLGAGLLRRRRA